MRAPSAALSSWTFRFVPCAPAELTGLPYAGTGARLLGRLRLSPGLTLAPTGQPGRALPPTPVNFGKITHEDYDQVKA